MLRKIATIAFLYLKTTYSSRAVYLFSLGMPLLFTFVLGQAMRGMGPQAAPDRWPLLVVDEDQSEMSAALLAHLERNSAVEVEISTRESALARLADEEALAALVVPAGFGAALEAGKNASLEFHQNANQITRAQLLEQVVQAAAAELAGSTAAAELSARVAGQVGLFAGAEPGVQTAYARAAFGEAENEWGSGAGVEVETTQVTRMNEFNVPLGSTQSSPGMLVMYALFFTFGGGVSLLVEREEGTLRRLLVMPIGKGTIMTGKLLGIFLGALAQMAIMVAAGQWWFGVEWGRSPAALVVVLAAYGLAGTGLGLLVAALARTTAQANALGTILVMAFSALGGAWWPIEIVPGWMQTLALALPTGWAMRGFHDIITRGLGLEAVALEALVLVGFAAVFLAVGIWRFRFES